MRVGTHAHRIGKGCGTPQCLVQTDGRASVRPRHDHDVSAGVARIACGAHARYCLGS